MQLIVCRIELLQFNRYGQLEAVTAQLLAKGARIHARNLRKTM